ncbi:MAG: tRNA-specific 2-thiouridylase MnmA [Nitrosomonadaceae bacterium]|nr:tRNA-specific 2-thiouridylase MnmA [Nitrosomonadaceae bacterium]
MCGPTPEGVHRGFAQVRAHGAAIACAYEFVGDALTVVLDEPLHGLATGQAVVVYDGDRVVGSATVTATL